MAAEVKALREQVAAFRQSPPSGPPIWSNWAMVVITAATAAVALGTLKSIKRQTVANVDGAKAALTSAEAAKASAEATMLAERACVDMSHFPPGLEISASQTDGAHKAKIKIAVKNYGRTPAEVRSVVLAVLARTGTLPDAPPYSGAANLGGEAFLMPGESFMVTVGWPGAPLPTTTASLRDVEMSGDGSAMTTWCPHVPSWRLRRESETRRRRGVANAGRWLWRRQDRTPYAPRGDAGCRAGVVDYWAGGPALGHGEERALPRMQLVVCFANSLTAAALLLKDFTSIIDMHRDARAEGLAAQPADFLVDHHLFAPTRSCTLAT